IETNHVLPDTSILPELFVKAFLSETAGGYILKMVNYLKLPVIMRGLGFDKDSIALPVMEQNICQSFEIDRLPPSLTITVNQKFSFLFFSISKSQHIIPVKITPWNMPEENQKILHFIHNQNIYNNSGFTINNQSKMIHFSGKSSFSTDINLPEGYTVCFDPGAEIDLINGAAFISHAPVIINGTRKEPVIIHSSDCTGQGFTVLQANLGSTITHAVFSNLSSPGRHGWNLTGAVNFYESDVDISNTKFTNNVCEDALNIIRSDFTITGCTFENIFADAFDSDFSTGKIINSVFNNTGNDAMDFSGSIVGVIGCKISNANDKAVSVGEKSISLVKQTEIINSNIALSSKDLSILKVCKTNAVNCNYGLIALIKKPEYGPAKISTKEFVTEQIDTLHLIERGSELNLNGTVIYGDQDGLAGRFY
ncbi:MAG: hypothetical protein KJ607_00915, partial [Bacteroidetes bacterium]|nr:hypothetical protein [Bacteroidota bacterium]